MKVLILGSGGREHALAWKIGQSALADRLFCLPGNAGMETLATPIGDDPEDPEAVIQACQCVGVDFVVVGPEAPLAAGLVDRLTEAGIAAFGPTAAAARLESSKGFAKDFCARHGIPTPSDVPGTARTNAR
jgi:phosphoribosylamine--glycine ligase